MLSFFLPVPCVLQGIGLFTSILKSVLQKLGPRLRLVRYPILLHVLGPNPIQIFRVVQLVSRVVQWRGCSNGLLKVRKGALF